MAATSVTGVGRGSSHGSEHVTLGISHIIGPKMDEQKAKLIDSHAKLVDTYAKLVDAHVHIIEAMFPIKTN